MKFLKSGLIVGCATVFCMGSASAQPTGKEPESEMKLPAADYQLITGSTKKPEKPRTASDYCRALSDVAGEARMKWQSDQLKRLQVDVRKATVDLEEKRRELEGWVKRRDEFVAMATKKLTSIFKQMKPSAAAAQLTELDDTTAAAILLKLKPRESSQIFNELEGKKAARLVAVMSGAAKTPNSAEATQ